MLLAAEDNLREVVAFPMNQQAEDLNLGALKSIRKSFEGIGNSDKKA